MFIKKIIHGVPRTVLSRSCLPPQIRSFASLETKIPNKACAGCGVTLQNKFKDKIGYVSQSNTESNLKKSGYVPAHELERRIEQKIQEHYKKKQLERKQKLNLRLGTGQLQPSPQPQTQLQAVIIPELPGASDECVSGNVVESTTTLDEEQLEEEERVCQRCFQLSHYGKIRTGEFETYDIGFRPLLEEILRKRRNRKCVVVALIDVFDLRGTFMEDLASIIQRNQKLILVVNKIDLMPKATSRNRIKKWVQTECEKLMHKLDGIYLISALKGSKLSKIQNMIAAVCRSSGRDVYVVGVTNVGKSTFINNLIRLGVVNSKKRHHSTMSIFPGTTVGLLDYGMPYNANNRLYDTPGVLTDFQYCPSLKYDELKAISPKKEIKPRTYRLKEGQSLMLGGLVRIDFVKGKPYLFTICASDKVTIHIGKIAKTMQNIEQHIGTLISPPFTYQRFQEIGFFCPNQDSQITIHTQDSQTPTYSQNSQTATHSQDSQTDTQSQDSQTATHTHTSIDAQSDLGPDGLPAVSRQRNCTNLDPILKRQDSSDTSEPSTIITEPNSYASVITADGDTSTNGENIIQNLEFSELKSESQDELKETQIYEANGGDYSLPEEQENASVRLTLDGTGWKKACADLVFSGIGWVSFTGCGTFELRTFAPKNCAMSLRDPIMPFEAKRTQKKWFGRHKPNL